MWAEVLHKLDHELFKNRKGKLRSEHAHIRSLLLTEIPVLFPIMLDCTWKCELSPSFLL